MICIYHSRDLDGWMSAAIVKKWHPQTKLIGWDYGMPEPISEEVEGNEVILVDISLSEAFMTENRNRITWIDHHKSAIDKYEPLNLPGLRDASFAACELTWKFFFTDQEMPEIVRLLGRYDCFGHKGTDEELSVLQFQYAARLMITNPEEALNALENMVDAAIKEWITIGAGIHSYLCVEAKQIYSRAFPVAFLVHESESKALAYQFLCVNQERFNPINFGIDYHKDGHNAFVCYWYQNGKWVFSVYNDNGEVDCSAICKMLGGGGHKGAAGFTTEGLEFIAKLTLQRRIGLTPLK